jgi:molybdate transport system substrate-binding protein
LRLLFFEVIRTCRISQLNIQLISISVDSAPVVEGVRKAAVETGIFPLGGFRVRTVRISSTAINWGIMKRVSLAAAISMLGLGLVMSPITDLQAAELRVLAGGSLSGPLNELGPQFERASGHKLVIHFDSTPNLIKQVTSGVPFDLAVVPIDVFKDAAAKARFVPGPTLDIARVGYGVIVRAGAPTPDVSTSEALKQALLKAQSIAFLPESAAGAYVSKVFERLGIGEAMKAKTRPQTTTTQIAPAVAKGEAELGVFLVNVLMAPGVELAGSFPAELQQELVFTAAVAADTKEAEAAKAFINFLTAPAAAAVIKAKGMSPG